MTSPIISSIPPAGSLAFWFEFASPYSYLAAERVQALARKAKIIIQWRPFLLGAIFKHDNGTTDSPFNAHHRKKAYMWRDIERLCQSRALPALTVPDPFPMNGLLAARLAVALDDDERLPRFIHAVYRAEFQQGMDISDPTVLMAILEQNGFDADREFAAAGHDATKARLRLLTDEAIAQGIFGAPAFITSDQEVFWGDDRLEQALEWAQTIA